MLERHPIPPVCRTLLHPREDGGNAQSPTLEAATLLLEHGTEVMVPQAFLDALGSNTSFPGACSGLAHGEVGPGLDLVIALGGDGTLLRASRWVAEHGVPVMGINLGDLGFLSAYTGQQLPEAMRAAVAGALVWEARERMDVEVRRQGRALSRQSACNDVYVGHGELPRMLQLVTEVGGQHMADFRADGLIVSTPTGSTAYNLSAGGPIVAPGTETFIIAPICPHSLTHRPVVTSSSSPISITYAGSRGGGTATLSVDGQWNVTLEMGDEVLIRRARQPLKLVPPLASVFEVLANKLGWSRPNRAKD